MKFVLNRDKTLVSIKGHAIEFKKNEPTHVPFELYEEAMAIGAIPESDIPEEKHPLSREPADPAARLELIMETFQQMISANRRGDFMGSGVPHTKALTQYLGFPLDNKERDELWQKFQTRGAKD